MLRTPSLMLPWSLDAHDWVSWPSHYSAPRELCLRGGDVLTVLSGFEGEALLTWRIREGVVVETVSIGVIVGIARILRVPRSTILYGSMALMWSSSCAKSSSAKAEVIRALYVVILVSRRIAQMICPVF